MKLHVGLMAGLAAIVIGGCASKPQAPVSLANDATARGTRIGVGMTALPKQDVALPGVSCLLCLATASIANSSLIEHAKTLPYEDLAKIKDEVAAFLRKRGSVVSLIEEPLDTKSLSSFGSNGPNIARKDFTPLREKYQVDKLLVVDIDAIGFIRSYSAYIPTSDPKGYLHGTGYLVDLKNNTYDWYLPVTVTKSSDGKWDEPPTFPGLTNAYFQTLAIGKDEFLRPFVELDAPASPAAVAIPPAPTASAEIRRTQP